MAVPNKINRPMTVKFTTQNLGKLSHGDILDQLETVLEEKDIVGIQLLREERLCFITLASEGAKSKLKAKGITLEGRYQQIIDADHTIIEVTIAGLPVEGITNVDIYNYMCKYGTVTGQIENVTLKRKDGQATKIKTGTRIVRMSNLICPLPNQGQIMGLNCTLYFYDGHSCRKCKQNHGEGMCPRDKQRACYNCGDLTHIQPNCPKEKLCYSCKQPGHSQYRCPNKRDENQTHIRRLEKFIDQEVNKANKASKSQSDLGNLHIHDNQDEITEIEHEQHIYPDVIIEKPKSNEKQSFEKPEVIILADSNLRDTSYNNDMVSLNVLPGSTIESAQTTLTEMSVSKEINKDEIFAVALHVGTCNIGNKIDHNKKGDSSDTCIMKYEQLINSVKENYPAADILISSIPPKKSHSQHNTEIKKVNNYLQKKATIHKDIHYINNDSFLKKGDKVDTQHYKTNEEDRFGIHLNANGKNKLINNIASTLMKVLGHDYKRESNSSVKKRGRESLGSTGNEKKNPRIDSE